ncbi:MAG: ABC transporter substrate-binding protein [Filifactoraceae bacterium]
MAIMVIMVISIVACGNKSEVDSDKVTLNVYNWGDYIAPEVIGNFEKETGIKVNYEEFATNEEMLAKIQAGGTAYDVICPSDYMIEYMINRNLLLELDYNNLPNYSNIDERFKTLDYDKEGKFSVPYLWGTMGIVYNKTMVNKPVDSWNILWDKDYEGNIIMLDSPRDTIGITLAKLGYSLNSVKPEELEKAKAELIAQKPLVRSYEIDTYKDQMIAGEAAMSLCWSGDAMLLMAENEDLAYSIPKEGTNLWFDAFAIPKTSVHKKEAEKFIDYMMKPEVAAANSNYIKFSSPNKEALKLLPQEEVNNEFLYPQGDLKTIGEVFLDLGEATTEYDKIWTEIKSS